MKIKFYSKFTTQNHNYNIKKTMNIIHLFDWGSRAICISSDLRTKLLLAGGC